MSDAAIHPTFMELYSEGHVTADEIDDFIERWHKLASVPGHSIPLYEFLGMTRDEYEAWVHDASILPHILHARTNRMPW